MMSTLPSPPPRWRLYTCLAYDALLLLAWMLCAIVPMAFLQWAASAGLGVAPNSPIWSPIVLVYTFGITYGYVSFCWRRSGQTLAMKTWRLRLVADEGTIDRRKCAIRYLVVALTAAPTLPMLAAFKHIPGAWRLAALLFALMPYLWSMFDRQGKYLQDRLAGTHIELMPIAPKEG